MNSILPFPTAPATRTPADDGAAPAQHVRDLLREIVIAMHATRPLKPARRKARLDAGK